MLGVGVCFLWGIMRRGMKVAVRREGDVLARFRNPNAFSRGDVESRERTSKFHRSTTSSTEYSAEIAVSAGISEAALEKVIGALRAGNKIEAIKHYRDATRLGLAEAKYAVERLEADLRL